LWYCNQCARFTKHHIRRSHSQTFNDENQDGSADYEILECAGCQDVSFRQLFWNSERQSYDELTRNDNNGLGPGYQEDRLPPKDQRKPPNWLSEITFGATIKEREARHEIVAMLRESYSALSGGLPRLSAMGTRAALDLVMTERVGDAGDFR
jgi:hypothetical protein